MGAIIFLLLPLAVLLVVGIAAAAVLEAAFAKPHAAHGALPADQRWHPPLAQGNVLLGWATATAAAGVRRLARKLNRETAAQLTRDTYAGIAYAISRLPRATAQRGSVCASCRHQMIGVTPPEALTIAGAVRARRSREELARIRDRAERNAAAVEQIDRREYERARFSCPLFLGDAGCAAFEDRPIHCRGWRHVDEGRHKAEPAEVDQAIQADGQAHAIAQGAEAGLARGLKSVGVDGAIYELNGALLTALDTPDAAGRWANGLPVFERCKHCQ